MFTNYTWLADAPPRSVALAGPARARDVYTGIDCFGRGTYGGGGFEGLRAALEVALRAGTSVALFAPSWTWENLAARGTDESAWAAAEQKLWLDCVAPGSGAGEFALPRRAVQVPL